MIAALALLLLAAAPGDPPADPAAAVPPAPPPAVAPSGPPSLAPGSVRVTLMTSLGAIVLDLDKAHAPLTAANFLRYIDQKHLDGTTFYRAAKVSTDPLYGLVQGGTRGDAKRSLPPIAHEPTTKTGLTHGDGEISMARREPGSARGRLFHHRRAVEFARRRPVEARATTSASRRSGRSSRGSRWCGRSSSRRRRRRSAKAS